MKRRDAFDVYAEIQREDRARGSSVHFTALDFRDIDGAFEAIMRMVADADAARDRDSKKWPAADRKAKHFIEGRDWYGVLMMLSRRARPVGLVRLRSFMTRAEYSEVRAILPEEAKEATAEIRRQNSRRRSRRRARQGACPVRMMDVEILAEMDVVISEFSRESAAKSPRGAGVLRMLLSWRGLVVRLGARDAEPLIRKELQAVRRSH